MVEINEIRKKILDVLKNRGPSLPIQIAKEINMNSLFVSAFLSELANDKKIKISSLKVGGSPLYFLENQEEQLERFYNFLHPKEAEAFLLLKKNKILKDSEQEPAIRVALRAINDFAVNFKKDEEIYWRYLQVPESEVIQIFSSEKPKKPEKIQETKEKPELKETEEIESAKEKETKEEKSIKITKRKIKESERTEFQNPLVEKPVEKPKKEKPKSDFVLKTIDFINKNFKIINEKNYKTKEYNCIVQMNSELGPIDFLTQAKDKKSPSDLDLKKLLSDAQKIPIPALMLYTGDLSKKAREYSEKYHSILKTRKIE